VTLSGDARRVLVAIVLVVLVAATLFGLWHLVVGGLINGNPRAGAFGVVLATAAGALLAGVVTRTRARPAR
jgi:membrane protease YdiL (CAAX protease family)